MIDRRHILHLLASGAALAIGGPVAQAAGPLRMTGLIDKAQKLPALSQRIDLISRALIGSHYRGYTLIGGPRRPEKFVTRDDVFDCVTYVEAVLAASLAHTPADYEPALRRIRYRDGAVAWRERNHYFSQWCERNVTNNVCRPIVVPGGETIAKTVNYMPALGARRMSLNVVPRADLLANKGLLATGDIIGFLSQRPGLDYFHIGFVVFTDNGELLLRHAAKSRGRVLDEPLSRFLAVNRVRAVTVLRPREPEGDPALI